MAQLSQAQQASDAIERPTIEREVFAADPGVRGDGLRQATESSAPSGSMMTHRFDAQRQLPLKRSHVGVA